MQTQKIPVVHEFMTRVVITLPPDMIIYEAIRKLLNHKISGAPIVEKTSDSNARVIGILSEKDCLSILTSGAFYGSHGGLVRDYMSSPVTTTTPDTGLFALANIFLQKAFRRLPVLDEEGYLVGIVSRRDVLTTCRKLWGDDILLPDSGYLTDEVKAKLGKEGVSNLHKHTQF